MTEKEFQEKHGLSDEDIKTIKTVCKLFKGKVTKISDRRQHGNDKYDKFDWSNDRK